MKTLETLGHHQATGVKGVFQYRRSAGRIEIDTTVSNTVGASAQGNYYVTNAEWDALLGAVAAQGAQVMRISAGTAGGTQPNLADIFAAAVATPHDTSWTWTSPVAMHSYIVAIMEHEGSLDLAHGTGAGYFVALENG